MISHTVTECRHCKGTVSREATACPHCGCPWPDGKPTGHQEPRPLTVMQTAVGVCLGLLMASAVSALLWFLLRLIISLI